MDKKSDQKKQWTLTITPDGNIKSESTKDLTPVEFRALAHYVQNCGIDGSFKQLVTGNVEIFKTLINLVKILETMLAPLEISNNPTKKSP